MTMVISAAWRHFAMMVSDRLVTLHRHGASPVEYDALANKTVIFITADAVLIFGYTGSAYLGAVPTDQWIAQALWGAPIEPNSDGTLPMVGGRRPGARSLNNIIRSLRRQLSATRYGSSVTIAATGFRQRRGRFIPVLISFSGRETSAPLRTLEMRPPRTGEVRQNVIGVQPTQADILAAHAEFGEMKPMSSEEGAWFSAQQAAAIIRRTAAKNSTVGPHVMKVVIPTSRRRGYGTAPWQRRVICRFELGPAPNGKKRPVLAYCPWIVTDMGLQPAAVMAGMGVMRNFGGWKVELCQKPESGEDLGLAFTPRGIISAKGIFTAQRRKPMPR